MVAHQAPLSLGFSRQEHWSVLPFPSPMHESEKWKWSRSVLSDPQRPHGLQPTRLLHPWDFPGKSTGVGCRCLLRLNFIEPPYFAYPGPIKDSKQLCPQHPVAEHHCPETSSPLSGRIFQCFLFLAGDSLIPVEVLSSEGLLLIATCPSASQIKLVLSAALSWPCLFPWPAL